MTAGISLIPGKTGAHFLRLRAIALALRVLRLRAIALALRVLRLRAIALALRGAPLQLPDSSFFSDRARYSIQSRTGFPGPVWSRRRHGRPSTRPLFGQMAVPVLYLETVLLNRA